MADNFISYLALCNKKHGLVYVKSVTLIRGIPGYHLVCGCDCGREYTKPAREFNRYTKQIRRCGYCSVKDYYLTYNSWIGMRVRCNSDEPRYKSRYKDRGITVCEEWKNNFWQFLADMGERISSDLSIDRIDNSKGYSKDNCRWASAKEQANNRG